MYGKTTATIQHYMNVVLSNRLSTVKVINSKIKSKIRFGCTFALLSVTLEPWAQCCSLLPSAFWRYSPSYHSHHIFLSRTGWSNALDQQQAQHGHGIQPYHVVWDSTLCAALLRVRRLQLGLVIAARVTAMPQAKAARDGGERTACLSHWRMVSARPATIFTLLTIFASLLCFQWRASQKEQLWIEPGDLESATGAEGSTGRSATISPLDFAHADERHKEDQAAQGQRWLGRSARSSAVLQHDPRWAVMVQSGSSSALRSA